MQPEPETFNYICESGSSRNAGGGKKKTSTKKIKQKTNKQRPVSGLKFKGDDGERSKAGRQP